ncbi:MAG: NAD(P)/FAD-dependent oxidoreductase [Candidatus Altiarchaeota archaeon]|nr:NAD(P)/FAD-dependent oxidoreductase [Candidatus Altiarchaeota archaeon]
MYDVVIIGAGIAGQTAAIYAARKRMDYLLLTKELGGQFLESGEILNYPGIVRTTGAEFSAVMREQLEFTNVKVWEGEVIKGIKKIKAGFKVVSDKGSYETQTVIIATGARPRRLSIPGEEEFRNKGVTYCSICDGPLFSGLDIAVVGGGNSALEAVDFTHKIAKKIYLINMGKKFSAHEYLIERIESYENVEVITEAETKEILGDEFVTGLVYKKKRRKYRVDVQGVIVEIGRTANVDFVKGFIELDDNGHIAVDCQMNTSVPGVFAAGDCAAGREYQYVISAGQGCMALLKAARYLANRRP